MKHLFVLFILFLFTTSLVPQTNRAVIKLNTLDFSRFPQSDLYVTLTDSKGDVLTVDSAQLTKFSIQQDRYNLYADYIQSVYDLKQKGLSELYIGLVFDNSTSMYSRIDLLNLAAERFVAELGVGDYAAIFDFGNEINKVTIPEINEPIFARQRLGFSSSKPFLTKAVKNQNFTLRTYMFDALLYSLSVTNRVESLGKKVIVFFSDGVNVGSEASPELVSHYSKEYDIPIYAIDLNTTENITLKRIASESGGEYFFVKKPEDLLPLYESLIKLLKSQYRITYKFPLNVVDQTNYKINLTLNSEFVGSATRNFPIDGEKIGYYNLLYYQTTGKEDLPNFINFISAYPQSKWRDDVELLLGNYWFRRNEYSKALAVYNRILRDTVNSAYAPAQVQKAKLLIEANQLALARKEYKQIMKRDDNGFTKPRAMIDLAKSYSAEGNYSLALDTYANLISEYEGTDFASDALLQSASLNLSMGDLSSAQSNLNEILTNYPESKNSVFAKMELANIEGKNYNYQEAIDIYADVITSAPSVEVLEEAKIKYAELNFLTGKYQVAINTYTDITKTSPSPTVRESAQLKLIQILLITGAIGTAREIYSDVSPNRKKQLLNGNERYRVNEDLISGTALGNGTFFSGEFDTTSNVLQIYENAELRTKFPVIGSMYQIAAPSGKDVVTNLSLTIEKKWIEDNYLEKPGAGVYRLDNTNFIPVESIKNIKTLGYDIKNAIPGIYAILTQEPVVITLYNINFDLGKATIRKDAEKNLYRVIDFIRYQPNLSLEIAGHTDSTGTDEINYNLSLNRAETIKNFMIQNGVDPSRLTTRGYGSQFPLEPNNSEESRQKNRRTEFIVLKSNTSTDGQNDTDERFIVSIGVFTNAMEVHKNKEIYKAYFPELLVLIVNKDNKINYLLTLGVHSNLDEAKKEIKRFKTLFNSTEAEIIKL